MSHAVRFVFSDFDSEETHDKLLKQLEQDNWDDVSDGGEDYIEVNSQCSYSFNIKTYLEKNGIKGRFEISYYDLEKEPDEVLDYDVMR